MSKTQGAGKMVINAHGKKSITYKKVRKYRKTVSL